MILWIKSYDVTIHMKPRGQLSHGTICFLALYKIKFVRYLDSIFKLKGAIGSK